MKTQIEISKDTEITIICSGYTGDSDDISNHVWVRTTYEKYTTYYKPLLQCIIDMGWVCNDIRSIAIKKAKEYVEINSHLPIYRYVTKLKAESLGNIKEEEELIKKYVLEDIDGFFNYCDFITLEGFEAMMNIDYK